MYYLRMSCFRVVSFVCYFVLYVLMSHVLYCFKLFSDICLSLFMCLGRFGCSVLFYVVMCVGFFRYDLLYLVMY